MVLSSASQGMLTTDDRGNPAGGSQPTWTTGNEPGCEQRGHKETNSSSLQRSGAAALAQVGRAQQPRRSISANTRELLRLFLSSYPTILLLFFFLTAGGRAIVLA